MWYTNVKEANIRNLDKYREYLKYVEEGYFIYKQGRIYRTKKFNNKTKKYEEVDPELIAKRHKGNKYRRFNFKGKTYYEHTCVYVMFRGVDILEDYEAIDHINEEKLDNRICNLEVTSTRENTLKAEKAGNYRRTYGEINGMVKLKDEEIDEIRDKYVSKKYNQYELAEMYGVTQGYISNVVTGKVRKVKTEISN